MSVVLFEKLPLHTFLFEFDNLEWAYGRKSCYICFALQPIDGGSGSKLWGYATNRAAGSTPNKTPEKNGPHAEELLLDAMERHVSENGGGGGAGFCVDWFMSWSPCARCSELLCRWLSDGGRRHRVRVSFARVYREARGGVRAGLRRLRRHGAELCAMDAGLYECCVFALVDVGQCERLAPRWLEPWCKNVPRVRRVVDAIMDEEDDDWNAIRELGELLESSMGRLDGWDDDDWQLLPEDSTEVAERTTARQGSPEVTEALTTPKKRKQCQPAHASTAKRALFQ